MHIDPVLYILFYTPCIKTFIGLLIIIAINTTNKEMTGMKQIVSKKLIDSM